jgi:hypothetical protein
MALTWWTRSAVAGVALITVGCSVGQAHPGSRGPGPAFKADAASAVESVSCRATTAPATAALPADFRPVTVVRCDQTARGINGRGLWLFEVKQRANHGLGTFIAALRRPTMVTPADVMCPAVGYLDPSFVLIDQHGRVIRPALPVMECGQAFPATITALDHLNWVTVSVRRTVQLATRAELVAGCDLLWKDVIKADSQRGSTLLEPSAGGPAFSPRPARLRICIYQDPSRRFLRGGFVSQAAESRLLVEIQGGRTSTRCGRRHTVYAVLLAVSPPARGGQVAEAELGGCGRILRPDNRVGTVSRAGLAIISQAGRP